MALNSQETIHDQLIRKACDHGWSSGRGWKSSVCSHLQQVPWSEDAIADVLDVLEEMPCIPDAWRFLFEGKQEGWASDKILVIELLEVEVSNPVSNEKLEWYEHLWWAMDSTASLHLRIFRMDRFGYILPLCHEHTILELISRRHLGSVNPRVVNIINNCENDFDFHKNDS